MRHGSEGRELVMSFCGERDGWIQIEHSAMRIRMDDSDECPLRAQRCTIGETRDV